MSLAPKPKTMSLNFDWSYFWMYYRKIDHEASRRNMEREVLADDWLFDLPSDEQISVLKDAPQEFIEEIKARLKPDVLKILKPDNKLIDWSKL